MWWVSALAVKTNPGGPLGELAHSQGPTEERTQPPTDTRAPAPSQGFLILLGIH